MALIETILALYALPYDSEYPVVCFDERPCFLIGQVRKEHYVYEKFGSCALLAAIEPLTSHHIAQVFRERTKREYALFFQALAARFP